MDQHGYAVAIVGASGEVGRSMIETLERYPIPVSSLRLLASKRSAGKTLLFKKEPIVIEELSEDSFEGIDLAFFSTSAFRMDPTIPLVVPEVNAHVLSKNTRLIANPNCSTIQLVVALKPLIEAYGIESVNVSTYQAISGAGAKALYEYEQELSDESYEPQILPTRSDEIYYQIAHNVIPQIDVFLSSGYTKEEIKMINETQKILDDYELKVNATCVRVPVLRGHSESVYIETKKPIDIDKVFDLFLKCFIQFFICLKVCCISKFQTKLLSAHLIETVVQCQFEYLRNIEISCQDISFASPCSGLYTS